MQDVKVYEDSVTQANIFIEKTLPMYVHHQIIEGLSATSGEYSQRLAEFEQRKLQEVFEYYKEVKNSPPDVKKFRTRIENFTENLIKNGSSSLPFTFGPGREYWPDMNTYDLKKHSLYMYAKDREEQF